MKRKNLTIFLAILGLLIAFISLYYDHFKKQIPEIEIKEYIFGNKYFWLQIITDQNNKTLAYGVTTRVSDFNPEFEIPVCSYNNKKDDCIPYNKVILGKTKFSDIPIEPESAYAFQGVNRIYYDEEYWFGNPGYYQSYFIGLNDSGYISKYPILFDFIQSKPGPASYLDLSNQNLQIKRGDMIVNTFFVTSPSVKYTHEIINSIAIGPNLSDVRVLPENLINTNTKQESIEMLKKLSSNLNIDSIKVIFGEPLLVNEGSWYKKEK